MTNRVTKLGIAFVVMGVTALLVPALGIDLLTADRSVQVTAAETPATAYLGIDENEPDETVTRDCETNLLGIVTCDANDVTVIELENNVDSAFDSVTVDVVSVSGSHDAVLQVANDEFSSLEPDDPPQSVQLECGQGSGDATNADVTLAIDAAGSDVSVAEATHTVSGVSYDCEEDDSAGDGRLTDEPVPIDDPDIDLRLVPDSPEATAPTGLDTSQGDSRVAFDIENTGSVDATVTGITVTDAGNATRVDMIDGWFLPERGDEVTIANPTSGTSTLDLEGSLFVGDARYDLTDPDAAALGPDDTAAVGLEQFRDGDTGETYTQVDMSGESVTLVLYVEGASADAPDEELPVEIEFDLPN